MITIREVTDADLPYLSDSLPRLWSHFQASKDTWLRRFEIWWARNPALTPEMPKGWMLLEDEKLVGFIGNVPVKFRIAGEEKIAVASVNWYVDPSVRGLNSLKLFMNFLKQKHASLFLFNTRKKELEEILTKFKFEKYILPRSQREYFYLLDRRLFDKDVLVSLFYGRFTQVGDYLGVATRLGKLLVAFLYQKPFLPSRDSGEEYTTSLCTECDDSFTQAWESGQNPCGLTLSHDTATLNWLYFASVPPNNRVVIQCRRTFDQGLAGYMVFDITRKGLSRAGVMELKEVCIPDADAHIQELLISYAIQTGKQNGATVLVLWADGEDTESYLRRTFPLNKSVTFPRFIRVAETLGVDLHTLTVCPAMIAPPGGIDHI